MRGFGQFVATTQHPFTEGQAALHAAVALPDLPGVVAASVVRLAKLLSVKIIAVGVFIVRLL